ncbi:MAG: hypothetical protein ACOZQL_12890 [Myxococcota bacterium]
MRRSVTVAVLGVLAACAVEVDFGDAQGGAPPEVSPPLAGVPARLRAWRLEFSEEPLPPGCSLDGGALMTPAVSADVLILGDDHVQVMAFQQPFEVRVGDAPTIRVGPAVEGHAGRFEWTWSRTSRESPAGALETRSGETVWEFDRFDSLVVGGLLTWRSTWSCASSAASRACPLPADRGSCSGSRRFRAQALPVDPSWTRLDEELLASSRLALVSIDVGALSRELRCSPALSLEGRELTPQRRVVQLWQFGSATIRTPGLELEPAAFPLGLASEFRGDHQLLEVRRAQGLLVDETTARATLSGASTDAGVRLFAESTTRCAGLGCEPRARSCAVSMGLTRYDVR